KGRTILTLKLAIRAQMELLLQMQFYSFHSRTKIKEMKKFHIVISCFIGVVTLGFTLPKKEYNADLIIYGGTSAAITAAVEAVNSGVSVIVVSPDKHLGGLSSGGLGFTDTGNKSVIGGLAREFYHQIFLHYNQEKSWTWQRKNEYGNQGQGTPAVDGANRTMWIFEPHAAEMVFEKWVKEKKIQVLREELLNREASGIQKKGTRIEAIRTLSGKTFRGKMFIDATYEGDLMALAGVSYHVG